MQELWLLFSGATAGSRRPATTCLTRWPVSLDTPCDSTEVSSVTLQLRRSWTTAPLFVTEFYLRRLGTSTSAPIIASAVEARSCHISSLTKSILPTRVYLFAGFALQPGRALLVRLLCVPTVLSLKLIPIVRKCSAYDTKALSS